MVKSEKTKKNRLTLYVLGNFQALLLFAHFFSFKTTFNFRKFIQEHHQTVKQFGSGTHHTFCLAWSGFKLFARLSADDTCKQTINAVRIKVYLLKLLTIDILMIDEQYHVKPGIGSDRHRFR